MTKNTSYRENHAWLHGEYHLKPECASSDYCSVNTDSQQGKAILCLLLPAYAARENGSFPDTDNYSLRPDMESLFKIGFDKSSESTLRSIYLVAIRE